MRFTKRQEITEGTMAFHLEKPREFEFRAGQSIDLTLLDPPGTDSQGTIRTFTLASAPCEDDFMAATRIRSSAHKRVLSRLPEGVKLQLEGPIGSFLMHQNPAKAGVRLAGGIGITRFRQKSSALVDRLMSSCGESYSPEVRRNFFLSGPQWAAADGGKATATCAPIKEIVLSHDRLLSA